ncbi:MAG: phage tail tape measure protein, partial [Thermoplasmata archaeon]
MSAGGEELYTKIGFDVNQAAGGIAELARAINQVESEFAKLATATTSYNKKGKATQVVLQGQNQEAAKLTVTLKKLANGTVESGKVVKRSYEESEAATKRANKIQEQFARDQKTQASRKTSYLKIQKANLDAELKAIQRNASAVELANQKRFAALVAQKQAQQQSSAAILKAMLKDEQAQNRAAQQAIDANNRRIASAEQVAQRLVAAKHKELTANQKLAATIHAAMLKDEAANRRREDTAKRASAKIVAAKKREQAATEKATKATQRFGLTWEGLGRLVGVQVLHSGISKLTRLMAEGITIAREYNLRIAEIRTISQENQLTTDEWAAGLRKLSESFGLDAIDQAEGAYQTLSNQVAKGAETFKFMQAANTLAATGVASVTDSVKLLTAGLNSFQLPISEVDRVAAQFFKTVELGRTRVSEMANIFGEVGVLAKQSGLSITELQAAIAFLTRQGIKTPKVFTQLKGIFIKLIKP